LTLPGLTIQTVPTLHSRHGSWAAGGRGSDPAWAA